MLVVRRYCSDFGAPVEVRVTEGVPDTFRLVAPRAALDQFCNVVRRIQHMLGVRFSD